MNAAMLLAVWERCAPDPPVRRAIALLAAGYTERSSDEWMRVSVGDRDRRLFGMREELFGPRIETVAVCPQCQERLEMTFGAAQILSEKGNETAQARADDFEIECRSPNSADLLEASREADPAAFLCTRCVVRAVRGGREVAPGLFPEGVADTVVQAIADADPDANIALRLRCCHCQAEWSIPFDVVSYFWSEIDDWAARTLSDIHILASRYGWNESQILALSARRRQTYVEMVDGR